MGAIHATILVFLNEALVLFVDSSGVPEIHAKCLRRRVRIFLEKTRKIGVVFKIQQVSNLGNHHV